MRHLPVHWYEGQFLRPHHLQAADRYWTELTQTSERWDNPYGYGLYAIRFSTEALKNHQFEVHSLHARMRDGTIVSLDVGQEPDRINLKEAVFGVEEAMADLKEGFETSAVIRVYLAIPRLRMGDRNVAHGSGDGETRYRDVRLSLQDETSGGNDQEIEFLKPNVRLLLSTQNLSGYDLLPVAQLKRASEGEATPQLDETYIPPVISINAWPPLGRDIVREIYDMIGQKIEVLSQQVTSRGVGFDSRHPGDLDRLMMLSRLNSASATLGIMAFAEGVHPFEAYVHLADIVGALAIFRPERRVAEIPQYDHEDLARIFRRIRDLFESCLNAVQQYEFEQRFFVGVGMGLQVSLEPKWFNSDWQWYIGVNKGDLTRDECIQILSPGQLDWKFGSSRQVEALFQHRAEGLEMTLLDRQVRALPDTPEWVYFEVSRRDTSAWHDVQQTQSLALRLRDSLIQNLDRLQGERQLVVSAAGRTVTLEFALYAVPVRL